MTKIIIVLIGVDFIIDWTSLLHRATEETIFTVWHENFTWN